MAFIVLKDEVAEKFWLKCWRILIAERDANPADHWFNRASWDLLGGRSIFAGDEYQVVLKNIDAAHRSIGTMTSHNTRIEFGPYSSEYDMTFSCREVVIYSEEVDPDEIFIKISLMDT
jgi:hypothetical protein